MIYNYNEIFEKFTDASKIKAAIMSNNPTIYYILSKYLILSKFYQDIEKDSGISTADKFVIDSLIIFGSKVKTGEIDMEIHDKIINIKIPRISKIDLFEYLFSILSILQKISPNNPTYKQSLEFKDKIINGEQIHLLNEFKDKAFGTLDNLGCISQTEKEEHFNDALSELWMKFNEGKIDIFCSPKSKKLTDCFVYNRISFRSSLLSTYLIGIAQNIFLNELKAYKRIVSIDSVKGLANDDENEEFSNPLLLIYQYYRIFVDKRGLRAIISNLQYDCKLEDEEIKKILGLNNARYHSNRLKEHFVKWNLENKKKTLVSLHSARDYFSNRALKSRHFDKKIHTIEKFMASPINKIDLHVYEEEFHTEMEFKKYHLVFYYIYKLINYGKTSALTGLTDEAQMRIRMEIYKNKLNELQKYQVLYHLLYYGSGEPADVIIQLLENLHIELLEQGEKTKSFIELIDQLVKNSPSNKRELFNEIYKTNKILFSQLGSDENFN